MSIWAKCWKEWTGLDKTVITNRAPALLNSGEERKKVWKLIDCIELEVIEKWMKANTISNTSVSLQAREQECTSEERITSVLLLINQTWSEMSTFDIRSAPHFFWRLFTFLKFAKVARQGDRSENVLIQNVGSIARQVLQSNVNIPWPVKLP